MNPDWFPFMCWSLFETLVRTPMEKWLRVIKKKKIIETILKDVLVRERYEEGNSL